GGGAGSVRRALGGLRGPHRARPTAMIRTPEGRPAAAAAPGTARLPAGADGRGSPTGRIARPRALPVCCSRAVRGPCRPVRAPAPRPHGERRPRGASSAVSTRTGTMSGPRRPGRRSTGRSGPAGLYGEASRTGRPLRSRRRPGTVRRAGPESLHVELVALWVEHGDVVGSALHDLADHRGAQRPQALHLGVAPLRADPQVDV